MKSYIIILNYNGWRDTQECLESVLKLEYSHYQIIVVDNNSTNQSMDHLLAWAKGEELASVGNKALQYLSMPPEKKPIDFILYDKKTAQQGGLVDEEQLNNPIIFIQAGENKGFAAGNNIGIEYALLKNDADFIWCLNNDTLVDPDALSELVKKSCEYKTQNKKVGLIASKLMYYHQPTLMQGVGGQYNKYLAISKHLGGFEEDTGQYDKESFVHKIDYPIGASLFMSIDFIKDVGKICEEYFLYFEELDWSLRGKEKGWGLGYCWQSQVFHKEGGSIGSSSDITEKSELSDFYLMCSRLLFTQKFYPQLLWLVRLSFLGVVLNRLRRRQFKRLVLVYRAFIGDQY